MTDAPDTEQQKAEPDTRGVLSVSQLNDRIASVVEETPALHGVRCIGEVTDLHQNSTALYFTLTDGNAELPCMIWANRYRNMDADLEDGTEVVLGGDIDYWTEGGKNRPQTVGDQGSRRRGTDGRVTGQTPRTEYLKTSVRLLAKPRQYNNKSGLTDARYYHGRILPQECMLNFLRIEKE